MDYGYGDKGEWNSSYWINEFITMYKNIKGKETMAKVRLLELILKTIKYLEEKEEKVATLDDFMEQVERLNKINEQE
ncbi:MAG: hypothetical protein QXE62_06935 [Candidatus Nitrosocaldaceae archaeon]